MIDNRQKAAMFIAIINKVSKQINFEIKLESPQILYESFADKLNYTRLSDELLEYMKEDNDPLLYMQLVRLIETDEIRSYIDSYQDSELKVEILALCDAVDKLRTYGDSCVDSQNTQFPNLIPFFANAEAEALFQRAVKAGYLDETYKPKPGIKYYELRLISFAISEMLNLPYRQRWVNFDRQWGSCTPFSLGVYHMPMTKAKEFVRITQLYSEVDFRPILNPRPNNKKPFTTDMTKEQVIYLYDALRRRCYLSMKTKEKDFLAMFGFGKVEKPFIRWSGPLYALEYFIRIALADSTRDVWKITADWIMMDDEKVLNYETLKSGSSFVYRNRDTDRFKFCKELDKILAEARNIE